MGNKPDHSISLLVPYIRLTKTKNEHYTLWAAVFIPKKYCIPKEPVVSFKNPEKVEVGIYVEGSKKDSTKSWSVEPLKIDVTPQGAVSGSTPINVTVYLDDPEPEGSSTVNYDEAEQE